MKFSTFLGNEKVKSELSYLLESGRLPHAIILEGEEGIGKRTFARELVANMFCRDSKNNACYECAQCRKVMNGIHPDVFEYTAPNRYRAFSIDVVRDSVQKYIYIQPNEADYKVCILGNCQSMTIEAQNAILKILEEPPKYAVFILTVTNKAQMLETVLSRCVVFNVDGVSAKAGAEYICAHDESTEDEEKSETKEKVSYDDAYKAMTVCGGNIGKALLTIKDGKLSKIATICENICNAIVKDNEYDLVICMGEFEKNNSLMIEVLSLLKTIFRDAMLSGTNTKMLSGQTKSVDILSKNLTKQKLIKMINVCDDIVSLANKNVNNNILITKLSYDFRRAQNR